KDESIYVLRGEIILRLQQGDTLIERSMSEGEAFHIAPKVVHQFEAAETSDLLEASTPEIEDAVRPKDRYGRAWGKVMVALAGKRPWLRPLTRRLPTPPVRDAGRAGRGY